MSMPIGWRRDRPRRFPVRVGMRLRLLKRTEWEIAWVAAGCVGTVVGATLPAGSRILAIRWNNDPDPHPTRNFGIPPKVRADEFEVVQ